MAENINPDKLSKIRDYCKPELEIELVGYDQKTGALDLDALAAGISGRTAAVFLENPCYLGVVEIHGDEISRLAHEHEAICIVSVDPISLGVHTPPADYGADIVCGDLQPLGMHMQFGGGQAGFIASRDEERYCLLYTSPSPRDRS